MVGFFRSVCDSCIHSITASAASTQFDAVLFTDVAIEHLCLSLVDLTAQGTAPGVLVALLGCLHHSAGRTTPQHAICEHILPRLVQSFLTWLVGLGGPAAGGEFKCDISEHLAVVDRLNESLSNIFGSDPIIYGGRSIQENAMMAKSKWLAGRFYSSCFSRVERQSAASSAASSGHDRSSLHPSQAQGGVFPRKDASPIDMLFDTHPGGKPASITDLVCLCSSEMIFLVTIFCEAVRRGSVEDREMAALAAVLDAAKCRLRVSQTNEPVLALGAKPSDSSVELLLGQEEESSGVSELLNAAWLVKAVRVSLARHKLDQDMKPSDVTLRGLLGLRERLCAQGVEISRIARDMDRISKYKTVLMEYRSQISLLIERKKEESSVSRSGVRSDEEFLRYFTHKSCRLQTLESEMSSQNGVDVKMRTNASLNFETHTKQRKLSRFAAPMSPALTRGNDSRDTDNIISALDLNKDASASPLKILMQNLFQQSKDTGRSKK